METNNAKTKQLIILDLVHGLIFWDSALEMFFFVLTVPGCGQNKKKYISSVESQTDYPRPRTHPRHDSKYKQTVFLTLLFHLG